MACEIEGKLEMCDVKEEKQGKNLEKEERNFLCSYLKQAKNVISFSFLLQNWRTGRLNMSYLGRLVPMEGRRSEERV
jgi:hypothetical protein